MGCEEKTRLAQEYETATAKFAAAVRKLQRNIGTSTRPQYERLQRASDEARVKSEQARLSLEQHMATHDCSDSSTAAEWLVTPQRIARGTAGVR
jgi:hypothetical protein